MSRKTVHRCQCVECKNRKSSTRTDHRSINQVMLKLDERSRRLFAGLLARQIGRGGIARVVEITGLSRMTIRRGIRECQLGQSGDGHQIRQPGGGRKSIEKKILKLSMRSTNS